MLPIFHIPTKEIKENVKYCYIDRREHTLLLHLNIEYDFSLNPYYRGKAYLYDKGFDIFVADDTNRLDFIKIVEGKYSKVSDSNKELIKELSGLSYMVYNEDTKTLKTASLLLALEKHPFYKAKLENDLGVDLGDSELVDKLTEEVFIEALMNHDGLLE